MILLSEHFMTQQSAIAPKKISKLAKLFLYGKKFATGSLVLSEGFYMVFRHQLYKDPNNPANTRYVQFFCPAYAMYSI